MVRPDDYLKLPTFQRLRVRLRRRPRKYHPKGRPKRSRDELIDYLRQNKVYSLYRLDIIWTLGAPVRYDYEKEFGDWNAARDAAFGPNVLQKLKAVFNADYIVNGMLEFRITNRKKYLEMHKLYPEVFPSMRGVYKEFRSFADLKECARRKRLRGIIDEYMKLYRKKGRKPLWEECRREGVNIDLLVDALGEWEDVEVFLEGLAKKSIDMGRKQ